LRDAGCVAIVCRAARSFRWGGQGEFGDAGHLRLQLRRARRCVELMFLKRAPVNHFELADEGVALVIVMIGQFRLDFADAGLDARCAQ